MVIIVTVRRADLHMSILKSAGFSAISWAFATLTDLFVGGWLIDHLISKGKDESKVRKAVLVTGMSFGLAVFGATRATDPVWAIFRISIALGGLASAAPVTWSLPSLIAPKSGPGHPGRLRRPRRQRQFAPGLRHGL